MLPLHEPVKEDFQAVNQLIIDQLHSDVLMVENIGHYIVDAGGKRLRPLLVLLVARALGYQGRDHLTLAAVIEFIHTATLLHDDVVDTSQLRRGRSTANHKWGNAPSVLVGDFLYSRAFQMLVSIGNMEIMDIMSNATNIIAEGEVQQLINAGNPEISEQDYHTVIDKKTARLFQAAAQIGAVISGKPDLTDQLGRFGHHVGMAFQLMDDVLDYSGDAKDLGKNIGDDLAEGKPTLPLIYGMRKGSSEESTVIRQAILDRSRDNLNQVVEIIQGCGGLQYTIAKARQQSDQAISSLAGIPDSQFRTALAELAEFAITRHH